MERYQPQLGQLLRAHRTQKGYTKQALADAAGVDVRTVASLERGSAIQEIKLGAISTALGVSVADLEDLKAQALNLRRASPAAPPIANSTSAPKEGPFGRIAHELDAVDERIRAAFGELRSPARSNELMDFSSRRLISSLSSLGIPLEIILLVLQELPEELEKTVNQDDFSTAHIRSAVARIISGLSTATIQASESYQARRALAREADQRAAITAHEIKFDWASRYARRYGNPHQIIQVLEEDGTSRKLDYAFLWKELIPHCMKRILGDGFNVGDTTLISKSVIEEMARSALEEFNRIGLYSIRYRTALLLIEDMAIHPPHPWMVTPETKDTTIAYDFERAEANLLGLEQGTIEGGFDTSYRYNEILHHLCSAILAVYSGFLGHRDTSSIHLLRHWLNIEEENPVLWRSCDLRLINSDLAEIGLSKHEFSALLKRMEIADHGANRKPAAELAASGRKLMTLAQSLVAARSRMSALRNELKPNVRPSHHVFEAIARETAMASLGCKRVFPLIGPEGKSTIGFRGSIKLEKTMLRNRSGLTIFLFCFDPSDPGEIQAVLEQAMDQLRAHRMAETCIILCVDEPGAELKEATRSASERLDRNGLICTTSILHIREKMRSGVPTEDIIDDIFDS